MKIKPPINPVRNTRAVGRKINISNGVNIALGILTETLYAISIIFLAFLICLIISFRV
jgi:hypothetical protein